jgi:ankyrin repeat protein
MTDDEISPLHRAAQEGDLAAATALIDAGADIEIRDDNGRTPLLDAVWGRHASTVQLLMDRGADINAPTNELWTPLMEAVYQSESNPCNGSVVRALLDAGADIHAQNDQGQTALHLAIRGGSLEAVMLLIDRGADVNHQDDDQRTPLIGTVTPLREDIPTGPAMARALLEAGAVVDTQDSQGRAALQYAAGLWSEDSVRHLLDAGADAALCDSRGRTAEDMASPITKSLLTAHRERAILREASDITEAEPGPPRHI